MKKKICAVSSCRNGQTYTSAKTKKLGLKNKSLFKGPKEEIMLHQWAQILKSFRKPLTENCFVCEDHFDEDDIIRFYECQLKDETIHRLQRGKPELRKTAIPVATKILKPVDREIKESNNQGSMDMHEENNLTQLCTSNNTCNIDYPHQDHQSLNPQSSTIINDTSIQFDFDTVLSSFSHVPLPSCEWAAIRFFGIIRNACGSNTHPDPLHFAQMYRLMSVYSLVQPPRGSNITGGDILHTLIDKNDTTNVQSDQQSSLYAKLDEIVEKGINLDKVNLLDVRDHNYNECQTVDIVKAYISGYVAHKTHKFTKCQACIQGLTILKCDASAGRDDLISLKSRGGLLHPSEELFNLVSILENTITNTLSADAINSNILFDIIDMLETVNIPLVGCTNHRHFLTVSIMKFYLIMRMNFACDRFNEINKTKKEKTKMYRKQSKLI